MLRRLVVAAFVLAVAAPVVWARAQSQAVDPGSIAALAAEVRQIRLALEESSRAQIQTQAIAFYLTVQKDRVLDLTKRLDRTRAELREADTELRDITEQMRGGEQGLADGTVSQGDQEQVQRMMSDISRSATDASAKVQQIRLREQEMTQALQAEEARWNDLVSRMEQAIRR